MSDSTIKCDKCDEEFVDSESFESHKEMSHENDSFQFIDSRNAVDEEEFVRRNSTKGYNPNPNAGLYDNKLFREGSAKERTSMLGESKATEVTDIQMNRLEDWISPADDYGSTGRMKCDICGKIFESHESEDLMYDHLKNTHETNYYQNTSGSWGGWESKANELLSFDQASTLHSIKIGLEPDIISQDSLDQLKMLDLVDDNNNLTPEGYRYTQNLQDQKPPLRDPEQKLNYTRTEDPHGGHYWDKYDKSWESKANEWLDSSYQDELLYSKYYKELETAQNMIRDGNTNPDGSGRPIFKHHIADYLWNTLGLDGVPSDKLDEMINNLYKLEGKVAESKANEVDGYTVLDKDGDETPTWYESDNLSDAKREADRLGGSVIEVPSFGGVIDKEVGNIVYRSGESYAKEDFVHQAGYPPESASDKPYDWWEGQGEFMIDTTKDDLHQEIKMAGDRGVYDVSINNGLVGVDANSWELVKAKEELEREGKIKRGSRYDKMFEGGEWEPYGHKEPSEYWFDSSVNFGFESYAKEDDYQHNFDELTSLAQDKIEDGNISQSEWDGSSEEERKDIESVLHGDESDDDGTMLHGSGWNSGAETEPIESNDYLEARDQAISKALKAPIEVEDDYEKVDYEKEDELSAGFIEEQHTERAEDKNKFLDDIDISLENIDYVYPTKIGEAIGKSYITEAIEGLDEEYEGLEDSDEEEVIELVTERKMGGFSNESIARELHITYGVSPEYALSRVHGIEVTTNDKVANTFFGKKYKDCTESEKDELKMYSGSDY